jgi:ferredoxin
VSSQATLSRRALLGFLRKKEEPRPPVQQPAPAPASISAPVSASGGGFSLESFYSSRAQAGEAKGSSIPVFSLREGLVVPQDGISRIGMAPSAPSVEPQAPEPRGTPERVPVPGPGRSAAPVAGMAVKVRPQLCLAWQGSFCSTCSERCPVEGAISVDLGRPRIDESRCNGCGLCVQACPAPLNALEFLPSRQQVPAP